MDKLPFRFEMLLWSVASLLSATALDVNLSIVSTDGTTLPDNGLWLFCIADQNLRDVDWYQNNIRVDNFNETRLSDFECPENITEDVKEVCEISVYSHGYQLYVPQNYFSFSDTWKCFAEPEEGYPAFTTPQEFKIKVCDSAEIDLLLILDGSGSVGFDNFDSLLKFIKEFLWHTDIDSGKWRLGIIQYSTDANVEFYLANYTSRANILHAVDNIQYQRGWTNTAGALNLTHTEFFSVENGDRPSVPNIAILFTDGLSNKNADQTIPEATTAKEKGITIYTVSIRLSVETEVEAIATAPYSDHGFVVDTFDELKTSHLKLFRGIFKDILCEEPIPVLTTSKPADITTAAKTTDENIYNQTTTTYEHTCTNCACASAAPEIEISSEELSTKMAERRERLKVDLKNTKLETRKLTSANDDRLGAQAIGYVSVVLLSSIFIGFLTIDCIDVFRNRYEKTP